MGNRKQPFGYQIKQGEIVIHPQEAEVVKHIFQQYIAGVTYQKLVSELKEQPIPYDHQKQWNKNMVARILGDRRYQGERDYPVIVAAEDMDAAAKQRGAKQCQNQKTEVQKTIRRLSGHVSTQRVERQVLDVLNSLIDRPDRIQVQCAESAASTEMEVLQRQLETVMEQQPVEEDAAKALVLAIASARYSAISSVGYETERLRRVFTDATPMKELNADLLRSTVSAIQRGSDGTIRIRLKNEQTFERSETL